MAGLVTAMALDESHEQKNAYHRDSQSQFRRDPEDQAYRRADTSPTGGIETALIEQLARHRAEKWADHDANEPKENPHDRA